MNLILLQHGFVIATIKGDSQSKNNYYTALETAQKSANKEDFFVFIAQIEKQSLKQYLEFIGQ